MKNIFLMVLIGIVMLCAPAGADNWSNSGGNAGRNGMTSELGPTKADLLWSGSINSLIAWQPVIEDSRVFMVRQPGWPGDPGDSFVIARDLDDGGGGWDVEIPYNTGDWITWVAGVSDGVVYASRSGNGASVAANLYALDATDGHIIWESEDMIDAGPYDGVVFADNGDPVIGSFQDIWRIDAIDGSTVWHNTRACSVSGSCGGAIFGDSFYVVDATGGGHVIVRFDLETGLWLYESSVMEGFLVQNTPMIGPDGTIYFNRVQNNAATDYFYSFSDDGSAFKENWRVPAHWGTNSEFGIGPDGSIYMVMPGPVLARLNPDDGSVIDSYTLSEFSAARMAVDAAGNVYFSNSSFADGHFTVFSPDLTVLWDTAVTNINIGGPAIGHNGTLVLCGVGNDVRAYRQAGQTPTVTPTPSESPTPTVTASPTEVPSPTPTPTPTPPCTDIQVTVAMPAHMFAEGDECYCRATVCNPTDHVLSGYPLFVILDVYRSYYFAPSFGTFDNYLDLYPDFGVGETVIEVIQPFVWPSGTGTASGLVWYGALTDPDVTAVMGDVGTWEFGWGS